MGVLSSPAVGVTIQAAGSVIGYIFMLAVHLGPVVTFETVIRTAAAVGMAGRAYVVRPTMARWEGVGKRRRLPGIGGVALRALAGKVAGWGSVARGAVRCTSRGVVERHLRPGTGIVAQ